MLRSEGAALKQAKRGYVMAGFVTLAAALPIAVAALASGIYPLLALLVHCGLFGSMALGYGFGSTKNARFTEGTLTVDEDSVALDGRVLVRRDQLKQGFVVPTEVGTLVRLDRKGLRPALYVRVRDDEEAKRVLDALGFDATHVVAHMRIASGLLAMSVGKQLALMLPPIATVVALALGVGLTMPKTGGPAVMALVAALFAYVLGVALTPTNVRIGTDGIVTQWLGRARFIPFSAMGLVEKYREYVGAKDQRGVRLTLRDGETVKLPTGQTDIGDLEAARLAARIGEARDAHRAGSAQHPADLLLRGDRTLVDWVRMLRRLGAGAHGMRTAAVPHDVLLGLVEDSSAPPMERASAAVAVLASSDPELHRRVRVAAETTASPKLRVALERITSADDDQIMTALGELDEPDEEHPAALERRTRGA